MNRLIVLLLALLATACSTPERLSMSVNMSGYGIETYKDQNIPGRYRAACAYDASAHVSVEELRWKTMLDGIKTAKQDGYDLVTWGGPTPVKLTTKSGYRGGPMTTVKESPGFIYSIQGFKSSDPNHNVKARPPDELITEINRQLVKP